MSITNQLPERVQARIARGEIPPPRKPHEPVDRLRDLRLSIAIAEDQGDWETISHLNAVMLNEMHNGATSDWKPQVPAQSRRVDANGVTKAQLLKLAQEATDAGDDDRAHVLKVRAMHAPVGDNLPHLEQARTLDEKGDHAEANRARVLSLMALRGDPPPAEQPPAPAVPTTVVELNNAIREAESSGDHGTANRLRVGLLHLQRQRQEGGAVDFAPQPKTPDDNHERDDDGE